MFLCGSAIGLGTGNKDMCIYGEKSYWRSLSSGVPQRPVLGPLSFITCVNGLDLDTSSSLGIFTNNIIIGRTISEAVGCWALLNDLDYDLSVK